MGEWRVDGNKLKAARQRAALTMRQLEAMSGVRLQTIHRIEAGKVKDSYPTTIRKLATALGVQPADLLSEHEKEIASEDDPARDPEAPPLGRRGETRLS